MNILLLKQLSWGGESESSDFRGSDNTESELDALRPPSQVQLGEEIVGQGGGHCGQGREVVGTAVGRLVGAMVGRVWVFIQTA